MKIVLQRTYRPYGADEGEVYQPGETLDLPDDEAQRALDNGIAQTPEDAAKSPEEAAAVALLTELGYTVTPPKAVAPKAAPAPVSTNPAPAVD